MHRHRRTDLALRGDAGLLGLRLRRIDRRYLADLTVTDEKLFTLPETGADGTGFYVTAGIVLLAVSAGIYIIVRKLKQ